MVNSDKLIKNGIKYTDQLFGEISKRLEQGVRSTDTLEAFLAFYHDVFPEKDNPLIALGYDRKMLDIILAETNNHKFSRPAQKELVRVTVENKVGDLIADVGEDVKESVREIVKDGYNNNLSQDEIAENITKRVSVIKNKRARAIARTEIARTAVVSDYIINKEMGATHFYVECRNTACPICKEAWHDKWTEETDSTFTPSDSSAGGKGWIGDKVYSMGDVGDLPPKHPNCRCVPYFITESEMPKGAVVVGETMTINQTNGETMVTDEIQVKGLENFETFTETIEKDNKKLYRQCKRHDCFEEVYNILRESQVSEFDLEDVQIIDVAQLRKDDLKEYIQMTDVDLFDEIDGFDISWKKFCEAFDLIYEFANGRKIIDMEKVRDAVVEGINEGGYSLCYGMETKSKNKKGEATLILAIDF